MFKLVVLSALLAVAMAAPKPGLLAAAPVAYSSLVGSVPTSVSSSSSSVVHSAALAAPAVAAYAAPAYTAYAAPAYSAYAAPAITSYSAHGLVNGYGLGYAAAPWGYGLHGAALI